MYEVAIDYARQGYGIAGLIRQRNERTAQALQGVIEQQQTPTTPRAHNRGQSELSLRELACSSDLNKPNLEKSIYELRQVSVSGWLKVNLGVSTGLRQSMQSQQEKSATVRKLLLGMMLVGMLMLSLLASGAQSQAVPDSSKVTAMEKALDEDIAPPRQIIDGQEAVVLIPQASARTTFTSQQSQVPRGMFN